MKVIISFVTFNTLKYTKLCLKSIKCSYPHEILVVDNGSIDGTVEWLNTQDITLITNGENLGLPYAYNTMYDYAWNDVDNLLVVINNDNVCLPNTIDDLVRASKISDASVLSGNTVTSPIYCAQHPEDRRFFAGGNNITTEASGNERDGVGGWSPGAYYNLIESTSDEFISVMYDRLITSLPKFEITQGGCYIPGHRLYKKPYFDVIGYFDVNFYPLYNLDCDYAMRAKLANQNCVIVNSSICFEFWSRALYESIVPIRDIRRHDYYIEKWGDVIEWNGWSTPFNGRFPVKYRGYDTSNIRISSREGELERIHYLMSKR